MGGEVLEFDMRSGSGPRPGGSTGPGARLAARRGSANSAESKGLSKPPSGLDAKKPGRPSALALEDGMPSRPMGISKVAAPKGRSRPPEMFGEPARNGARRGSMDGGSPSHASQEKRKLEAKPEAKGLQTDDSDAIIGLGEFRIHEKVEARYKGKIRWLRGQIVSKNRDGTYDVRYDDGEEELNVPGKLIRSLAQMSSTASFDGPEKTKSPGRRVISGMEGAMGVDSTDSLLSSDAGGFAAGQRVEADYKGKGRYYKGRITKVYRDGSCDIDYDDGEKERLVDAKLIRSLLGSSVRGGGGVAGTGAGGKAELEEGMKVEADYKSKGRYYKGRITKVYRDGSCDIDYDDGEKERMVDPKLIKPLGGGSRGGAGISGGGAAGSSGGKGELEEGMKVEADYKGKGRYYKGRIVKVYRDGSCDIDYDDGEKERMVDPKLIKPLGGTSSRGGGGGGAKPELEEGMKVEADYKGKGRYYKGRITKVYRDGSCDIDYDDGEKERMVDPKLIKPIEGSSSRGVSSGGTKPQLEEGMKVEADYKGKGRYYKGRIMKVYRDGSCDIDYDDGEKERMVDPKLIKVSGGNSSRDGGGGGGAKVELEEGMKVEADYKGKGRYYKGRITKVYRDGSCDVDYDDGEKERMVDPKLIKPLGGNTLRGGGGGTAVGNKPELEEGMKVEADYKSKGRYYKGRITKVHRDGSCDIDYDDGEKERMVDPKLIKPLGGTSSRGSGGAKPELEEGMKVEADFKGKGRYYKGRITKVHRDGSCDVDYDDGEKERMVDPTLIKPLGGAFSRGGGSGGGGDGGKPELEEGMKVEADYKGKGRYYKGRIVKVYRDGSCDVDYDDGEKERMVDPKLIKPLGGSSARGGKPELEGGMKVEADYRGKGRYCKGRIAKMYKDGTCDIDYDDGDSERNVDPRLIRPLVKDSGRTPAAGGGRGEEFEAGDPVEGNYKGKGRWFKGTVMRLNKDGTCHIRFEDGDEDRAMDSSLVRARGGGTGSSKPKSPGPGRRDADSDVEVAEKFEAGDAIEGNYKGKGRWFKGTVMRVNRDGTYHIRFDDGDEDRAMDGKMVRARGGAGPSKPKSPGPGRRDADSDVEVAEKFEAGDAIEGNYKGKGRWFKGTVMRVNRDGTYHVRFDDGDEDRAMEARLLRARGGAGPSKPKSPGPGHREADSDVEVAEKFEAGDAVEGNYKGKGRWFKGTVMRLNRDGTYYVRFDDGDEDRAMESSMVRKRGDGGTSKPKSPGRGREVLESDVEPQEVFKLGDDVEARLGGKSQWYRGRVSGVHRDDTYDIKYDTGEREDRVERRFVRKAGPKRESVASDVEGVQFKVGDKVEARYKGKLAWSAGRISAVHRDGTFDVTYSNGDREERVVARLIRKIDMRDDVGAAHQRRDSIASDVEPQEVFKLGEDVEARLGGKSQWYRGRVCGVHRDDSYDIKYDTGEREDRVERRFVRRASSKRESVVSDVEPPVTFKLGDSVEARLDGGSKWCAGQVCGIHRDGTLDIKYDHGPKEERVKPRLVRVQSVGMRERQDSVASVAASASDSGSVVGDGKEVQLAEELAAAAEKYKKDCSDVRKYLDGYSERDSRGKRLGLLSERNFCKVLAKFRMAEPSSRQIGEVVKRCGDSRGKIKIDSFFAQVKTSYAARVKGSSHKAKSSTKHSGRENARGKHSPREESSTSDATSSEDEEVEDRRTGGSSRSKRRRGRKSPRRGDSGLSGESSGEDGPSEKGEDEGSDGGDSSDEGADGNGDDDSMLVSDKTRRLLLHLANGEMKSGIVRRAFSKAQDKGITKSAFSKGMQKAVASLSKREGKDKEKYSIRDEQTSTLWSCIALDDEDGEVKIKLEQVFELLVWSQKERDDTVALHTRLVDGLKNSRKRFIGKKEETATAAAANCRKVLSKADSDGKGFLPDKVFKKACESLGMKFQDKDWKVLMSRFDKAGKGSINYGLFTAWLCSGLDQAQVEAKTGAQLRLLQRKMGGRKALIALFAKDDESGKGILEGSHFIRICNRLGLTLTCGQLSTLVRCCGIFEEDGSVTVRYKDFLDLMEEAQGGERPQSAKGSKRGAATTVDESNALLSKKVREALFTLGNQCVSPDASLKVAFSKATAKAAVTGKRKEKRSLGSALPAASVKQLKKLLVLKELKLGLKGEDVDRVVEVLDVTATGQVTYLRLLELLLARPEDKTLGALHVKLATALSKSINKKKNADEDPLGVTAAFFAKLDSEEGGVVAVADFKRGLDRLCTGLSSKEKVRLVDRFDPQEGGQVDYEAFAVWLTAGLDDDSLMCKLGRYVVLLKQKGCKLRQAFDELDSQGTGVLSEREMHTALRHVLGMPLADGELRSLLSKCASEGAEGSAAERDEYDWEDFVALCAEAKEKSIAQTKERAERAEDADDQEEEEAAGAGGVLGRFNKWKDKATEARKGKKKKGEEDDDNDDEEGDDDGGDEDGARKGGEEDDSSAGATDEEAASESQETGSKQSSRKHKSKLLAVHTSIMHQLQGGGQTADWPALFERRDDKDTGRVGVEALQGVLKQVGVKLTDDELQAVVRKFAEGGRKKGEPIEVAYYPLISWLEQGGGLDDKLLSRIQRHINARLSRGFDLRALFMEMTKGRSKLSSKGLTRGLRLCGIHLLPSVVEELMVMVAGKSYRGGDVQWEFRDFHRMVHAEDLADVQNEMSSPMAKTRLNLRHLGGADGEDDDVGFSHTDGLATARVDDEIYEGLMAALEKAFTFFDEDQSNSIDANELRNILNALGEDPSKKELKAIMRKADADRNGVLQFEEFYKAVMPYLMERATQKTMTESEMLSLFNAIDRDSSGTISKQEFTFMFCDTLKLITSGEAAALVSVMDRDGNGTVDWEEFMGLFDLMNDKTGQEMLKPQVREVVSVALKKLQAGIRPDPEEHLTAFLGMPSNYRRSVLAPLDKIREYTLQYKLLPMLDARGSMKLADMEVQVLSDVVTRDSSIQAAASPTSSSIPLTKSPKPGVMSQMFKSTRSLGGIDSPQTPKGKGPKTSAALSPPSIQASNKALSSTQQMSQRRRSSVFGESMQTTVTELHKSAVLKPVGVLGDGDDQLGADVWQVMLSAKSAIGVPVPPDVRASDVLQRSLRVCLFYQPPREEADAAPAKKGFDYQDYFLGNTYQTLAQRHSAKEECWNFPTNDNKDGDRKFLVRTDFRDESQNKASNRDRLFVLMELTCTVRTPKRVVEDGERAIQGPLKNFKAMRQSNAMSSDEERSDSDDEDDDDDEEDEEDEGSGKGRRRGQATKQKRKGKQTPTSPSKKRQQNKKGRRAGGDEDDDDDDDEEEEDDDEDDVSKPARTNSSRWGRRPGAAQSTAKGKKDTKSSKKRVPSIRRKASMSSMAEDSSMAGGVGGDDDFLETEMSCGWVLLPMKELVSQTQVVKLKFKLQGGTPFARSDINKDEVSTRRFGWRAVAKAMHMDGMNKNSAIEVKIIPLSTLQPKKVEDSLRLPRNIIVADTAIAMVRAYRQYAANQFVEHGDRSLGAAGFGVSSAYSEPVMALFPRIAADPAMMAALIHQYDVETRQIIPSLTTPKPELVAEASMAAFRDSVLRIWPAMSHVDVVMGKKGAHYNLHESYEERERRAARIKQIVSATDSFRSEAPSSNTGSRPIEKQSLFMAFSVKDVAFDVA